jgi:hypothetical protein
VEVRMVGHRRTPAMEDGGGADAGTQVLGSAAIVSSVSDAVRNSRW